MTTPDDAAIFDRSQITEKYVAFVDILGFGSRVLNNFDKLLDDFENFLRLAGLVERLLPDVQITVYSDSYLFVSSKLERLVAAIQGLHMQSLFCDYLLRGGIAYGRHVEASRSHNLYVVSEALAKAASIEKTIGFPCVTLHPDINIPDEWWTGFNRNIERGVLYFGGKIIVNPCNLTWGTSAATRVRQMLDHSPQYRDKYEWFLEMHEALFSPVPMVPPRFFRTST
jgi:hypothetical protein